MFNATMSPTLTFSAKILSPSWSAAIFLIRVYRYTRNPMSATFPTKVSTWLDFPRRNWNLFFQLKLYAQNFSIISADISIFQYNYSRMLWEMESAQSSGHLSGFVDKALKLLDLRQVMMEVETSVMSKVSCTACKVGAGLLQHYIKVGKSDEEIMNSIYQFCVSLNIQSSRVCQGVTLLFGVSFFVNLDFW